MDMGSLLLILRRREYPDKDICHSQLEVRNILYPGRDQRRSVVCTILLLGIVAVVAADDGVHRKIGRIC